MVLASGGRSPTTLTWPHPRRGRAAGGSKQIDRRLLSHASMRRWEGRDGSSPIATILPCLILRGIITASQSGDRSFKALYRPPLPPDESFRPEPRFSRRKFLLGGSTCLAVEAAGFKGRSLFAMEAPLQGGLPPPGSAACVASTRVAYPPLLTQFVDKLDPARDVFPTEVYAEQIGRVLDRWRRALCQTPPDHGVFHSDLVPEFTGTPFDSLTTAMLRQRRPLLIEKRIFSRQQISGSDKFERAWASYLGAFETLEVVELEIYGIRVTGEAPLRVETELHFDLVGNGLDGSREQRNGSWRLGWIRANETSWKLAELQADTETRSRLYGPGFTEITAGCLGKNESVQAQLSLGTDHWRTVIDGASGIDVYGNQGISVGDIDGSGFDSFYVCQPSGLPNRLYRNRGDGTFDDITEHSGTGILDGTASALFVDFLNRDRQDLLVVRTSGPLLFRNMGDGRFEPQPGAFHFATLPQGTFTSASVADYNRDGWVDVFFCVYSYYQGLNQYQFPAPYYDARNGPPNFLFRNRGDGTFEDVTASSGINQNNNRFSFAAAWCDYDGDGWPDLYVANDFGRKNLYRNHGDGTFSDVAEKLEVDDSGPGMSVCWFDAENKGSQDVYVANMWLAEGKRITASPQFLPGVDPAIRAVYQKHNAGNALYRNLGNGSFENRSAEAGTAIGRWCWSCASWDFDHDGYSDLYVANGFISGPNHYDLQSFFWRQVAQRSASAPGASSDYAMAWNAINELIRSDYSWSGYQRNVFFANNHDGTFSDVSGALGLDFRDDCRAYALSDFDHDGRLEFALKNRSGPQLRMVRNDLKDIGNSIALRLTGTVSNRDAIGAVVTLEIGAARQTRIVSAGSGFASQHTKELFFGVGEADGPVRISVRWPNGAMGRYEGVPINHRVELREGDAGFHATPFRGVAAPSEEEGGSVVPRSETGPLGTWLLEPLFGPEVHLPKLEGGQFSLSSVRGKPALLLFFRLGCGSSHEQLRTLQQGSGALHSAGLSTIAVCMDGGPASGALQELVRGRGITFPILLADDHMLDAWGIQFRYLFDRRRDINPPIAFLLDGSGAIIRVYQGLVTPERVAEDVKSAPKNPQSRFEMALPFRGPYYGNPMTRDYFTYGVAFIEYNFIDEAQAAFQRAVDANPPYASAWFNLGTIYFNRKMYADARRCLERAIQLSPKDADSWNNMGMISVSEGNYDRALQEFRKAAEVNPDYLVAVENMIRIYQFRHQPAQAQQALQELIALAPKNSDLHLALGRTLVAEGDLVGARRELTTSVRLRPDSVNARNDLGAVLLQGGEPQQALDQFEACQKLAPDLDRPYVNAATVYVQLGQPDNARKLLQDFLARHPDDVTVQKALESMGGR